MSQPRVKPLAMSKVNSALAKSIKQSRDEGVLSSTLPLQTWAHRPDTASSWLATLNSFYTNSLLSDRLRELVRLKIASITQCGTCQLARKSDEVSEQDVLCLSNEEITSYFTAQEQAALRFSELFAANYTAIDQAEFTQLEVHFSTPAIVELNLFCGLMLAGGRVTYVMSGGAPDNGSVYT